VYADDGVSGTSPIHERPEGRRLLEDAKAGAFGTLLVYRLDRLGRSLLVIVDAHDRLQAAGVALRSATEPIDTSSPSGRLIFQMLASFAEYERETIRERTRAGLHRADRSGKHFGPAPYGYRTDDAGRLQIVPEEAEIVRGIIGRVAEGSSLYAEAKRLNDLGVPTPGWRYGNGKKRPGAPLWSVTSVSNIVHQSAYSGIHKVKTNGGEDVIEQAVPPVLADRVLQDRAAAALTKNRRYPDRKKDRRYLLRGLVKRRMRGRLHGPPRGQEREDVPLLHMPRRQDQQLRHRPAPQAALPQRRLA
jgi:site-specific DNA recombinase